MVILCVKNGFGRPLAHDLAQDLPHQEDAGEEDQTEPPNAPVLQTYDRNPPHRQSDEASLEAQEAQHLIK